MEQDSRGHHDLYCYPGSVVLQNKLGIRDYDTLQRAQFDIVRKSSLLMPKIEPTDQGLRDAHLYLYSQLFTWAGQPRITELRSAGIEHAKPTAIASELTREFAAIKASNNLAGLKPNEFAAEAAERIGGLTRISPFREGNDVVLRYFTKHLAQQAGHDFKIQALDPQAWLISKQQSAAGNFKPMAETIRAGIVAAPSLGLRVDNAPNKPTKGRDDFLSR